MTTEQLVFRGASTAPHRRAALAAPFAKKPPGNRERMRLHDVSVFYAETAAVKNVSLTFRHGEILALVGPSGCGKTTLLRALNHLTELTPKTRRHGEVTFDGVDVRTIEAAELRSRVAMVFQQPNPFPMSVFDNVAFALREGARRHPSNAVLRPAVVRALEHAELYTEVASSLDRPALRLSGGQQQRLCIARAIATRPEVLLLDEPCSALDPHSTAAIEALLARLRPELATVIVTHSLAQARRLADVTAFMFDGELVEVAPTAQLFAHPRCARTRAYLGGEFG